MKNGDISNKPTPTILVRMDETIFQELPKDTLVNKIRKVVGLKPTTFLTLIPKACSFLSHVAYRTDKNLNLVYIREEDKHLDLKEKVLEEFLLDLNILVLSREELEVLLDYMEANLVDKNCCRERIYTLDEAIYLFK